MKNISAGILIGACIVTFIIGPGWDRSARACSCGWIGPFAKVVQRKSEDLVVYGRVLRYYKTSMVIKVLEALQGQEERDEIRVWCGDGNNCSPHVSTFPVGSEWVLVAHEISAMYAQPGWDVLDEEVPGDYYTYFCGEWYLEVVDSVAVGSIWQGSSPKDQDRATLEEIRKLIADVLPDSLSIDGEEAGRPVPER